ncbi:MAG: 3-deoxy-D-manno-octulosonic acid transferase [Comamonadaceae bacterium]|nr:MAG: 3-deoxy-D-manno-octulosonic acid transferase [Comamonadaceae bacterium]
MEAIALTLYSWLMWLAQPFLRRKLKKRGRKEPGYLNGIGERFGHYTQPAETSRELIWLHAVSLGETRAAAVVVKALRARHPGLRILLTNGTATGRAEGAALLRLGDIQVWQPWDNTASVTRFYDHFKPRLGLLMETEIWPNLVAGAGDREMPIALVNARLSEKSLQQALGMSPLSLPAYSGLSAVYAQTDTDAARLRQLGAPVEGVFGNLKFDASPDESQLAAGRAWRQHLQRPVLMFASSREGEEDEFFRRVKALSRDKTDAPFHVLVVPRHPQRFDEVATLAAGHGFQVSRRSAWTPGGPPPDAQADIWLGDSLGEMALYYAMSDAALLGGSFAELGGQNLIEAAACGCPVIMGPHTFNFAEAAELAENAGAARRVAGLDEAVWAAVELLGDPSAQAQAAMAASAHEFAAANRGATARTVAALDAWL